MAPSRPTVLSKALSNQGVFSFQFCKVGTDDPGSPIVQKRKLGVKEVTDFLRITDFRSDGAGTMAAAPSPVLSPLPSTAPALRQALPGVLRGSSEGASGMESQLFLPFIKVAPLACLPQSRADSPQVGPGVRGYRQVWVDKDRPGSLSSGVPTGAGAPTRAQSVLDEQLLRERLEEKGWPLGWALWSAFQDHSDPVTPKVFPRSLGGCTAVHTPAHGPPWAPAVHLDQHFSGSPEGRRNFLKTSPLWLKTFTNYNKS